MAKKKVLEIDYWNDWAGKTYNVPANTKCNTIKINGYTWTDFPIKAVGISADGKDLELYSGAGTQGWIIIKNYVAKNGSHAIKYFEVNGAKTDLLEYVNSELYRTGTPIIQPKNNVFSGNNFSNQMNGTEKNEKMYGNGGHDKMYGGAGNDTIDGGAGNDFIYGGAGNDKITGGKGKNTILLSTITPFGDDTYTLTKGEDAIFLLDSDSTSYADWYIDGKDLVIDVFNSDEEAQHTEANKKGSVRIKNYTKKDVLTSAGSIKIIDYDEGEIDLRKSVENDVIMDADHYKKTSYTGSWINDDVRANSFKLYKNGKKISTDSSQGTEITTETEGFEKVKGVSINLGGSSDDYMGNWAEGSIYADTIKGGAGRDQLYGGKGNDILTGGKGKNRYTYSEGDGADVINVTKDEEMELELYADSAATANIKMAYANKKKDVKIYSTDADGNEIGSVTLKGFAKKDITKSAEASLYVLDEYDEYDHEMAVDLKEAFVETNTTKNFTGTWMNDDIIAKDYKAYKKVGKNKVEITTETAGYQTTKGLTLKGGGGMDYVLGSIYADTIDGGAGHDGLMGGKGNDKLTGGKDADTFYFYKNDGVDTITDATSEDFIAIADDDIYASWQEGGASSLRYAKNGNNLEIFYSNEYDQSNKIVVQNYYKQKDAAKRVQYLFLTTTDMNTDLHPAIPIDLSTVSTAISGSGKINGNAEDNVIVGSAKADTIKGLAGADTIIANGGNDNIYGGLGNDTINAGVGKNNIYYSLGDGDDTILNGGGTDTLCFDKGTTVTAKYNGNDIVVTYSGTKKVNKVDTPFENAITIKDGKTSTSVESIKIGTAKAKTLDSYLNGGGGGEIVGNVIHIKEDDAAQTYNLPAGNNTVILDDAPMLGYGHTLHSANTAGNGYTDTIVLSGKNEAGKGISFMDNSLLIYGLSNNDVYTDDLWLDATAYPNCPGDGEIIYEDFYKSTAGNVVITDDERSYTANGYNSVQTLQLPTNDTVNRVIAIKAATGTSTITTNGNYNVVKTFGGASLNYTYNGGHDNVTSLEFDTDDTYNVALSATTSLNINDWGSDEGDTLVVTGTGPSHARILFDVYRYEDTFTHQVEYKTRSNHIVMTYVDNVSKDVLATATLSETTLTSGINLAGEIENVSLGGDDVNIDTWCAQIKSDVASWLQTKNYESVYDVFYGENACTDNTKLANLVNCYNKAYEANP